MPFLTGSRSISAKLTRREKRIARWRQPLTPRLRIRAWASMLFADHGLIRFVYPNRHRVSNILWRSAQPLPRDIAWAARQGIRTIVNLRGGREFGSWPLEQEACERHGLKLIDLPLYARGAPRLESIRWARRLFEEIEYPALIHCKSGADRAGLAAALYLILCEGAAPQAAKAQLHPRYGHLRWTKTGILDAFFEAYEQERHAVDQGFVEWLETKYDPLALLSGFGRSRNGHAEP